MSKAYRWPIDVTDDTLRQFVNLELDMPEWHATYNVIRESEELMRRMHHLVEDFRDQTQRTLVRRSIAVAERQRRRRLSSS